MQSEEVAEGAAYASKHNPEQYVLQRSNRASATFRNDTLRYRSINAEDAHGCDAGEQSYCAELLRCTAPIGEGLTAHGRLLRLRTTG